MPNFSGVWDLKDQVQAIAAGRWTGIPLGRLYGWGSHPGSLPAPQSSPVQVDSNNWSFVSSALSGSFAIKNGELWGWGSASFGRLGDGTVVIKSSPVQIGALTNWSASSNSAIVSGAIKTDGTLWMWGFNSKGVLGQNDAAINRSSPVQVGALTNWSVLAIAENHFNAIKTDGTLWACGDNSFGNLGTGNIIDRSSPVQVGILTTWARVASFDNAVVATKSDGTLWTWGLNINGQLGDNTILAFGRSSPVQIGALTNWYNVASGQSHTLSTKTDGTLWGWGLNSSGQVGDGTTISRSSPVQVGASTDWDVVKSASNSSIALKTNGTMWAWGNNSSGVLGLGDTANKSSPVQVGSLTSWSVISPVAAILQETTN